MNYYLESGYVNFEEIMDQPYPFTFLIGGRGTGKTYGALAWILDHLTPVTPFLWIRRRQAQVDILKVASNNIFNKINQDRGLEITQKAEKSALHYYRDGSIIGSAAALSTFANMRGFDLSSTTHIFYDEFQPETEEAAIKGEASKLWNLYESINRNRELEGRPAVKLVAMANSNDLGNPYFMDLQILPQLERMLMDGRTVYKDKSRGIMVIHLKDSPISQKKQQTALYKLTAGSSFAEMSLDNEYSMNDFQDIVDRDLVEYKPLVEVGGVCLYKHKSKRLYYATMQRTGSPEHFGTSERDLAAYQRKWWYLWNEYLDGRMEFKNYLAKRLLTSYNK